MINDRLVDELANVRYRLRHEAITEDFVEWLEAILESLRSKYRKNNTEFRKEDIIFLKKLSEIVPMLTLFLAFQRQFVLLKRGRLIVQELSNLNANIEHMQEDSFFLITKQLEELKIEINNLYHVQNNSV